MKQKWLWIPIWAVSTLVVAWVAFFIGRYSYLIRRPGILLSGQEKCMINKAREEAVEAGVPEYRLKNPRVVETVRVYFGEMAGLGGVEVSLVKGSGDVLNVAW